MSWTWRKQKHICHQCHCQRQFKSLTNTSEHDELNTKCGWQRHCQCHKSKVRKKCKWTWVKHVDSWGGMYLVEVRSPEDMDFAGGWFYAMLHSPCMPTISSHSLLTYMPMTSLGGGAQHRICTILLTSPNPPKVACSLVGNFSKCFMLGTRFLFSILSSRLTGKSSTSEMSQFWLEFRLKIIIIIIIKYSKLKIVLCCGNLHELGL